MTGCGICNDEEAHTGGHGRYLAGIDSTAFPTRAASNIVKAMLFLSIFQ